MATIPSAVVAGESLAESCITEQEDSNMPLCRSPTLQDVFPFWYLANPF
jgi:hypothetical protein